MAEASNNMSWLEKEEYFAEYFRSLRLQKRQRNQFDIKDYLPSGRYLQTWRKLKHFRQGEHEDIRAIAEAVEGEQTVSRWGDNIAKTAGAANLEHDGGEEDEGAAEEAEASNRNRQGQAQQAVLAESKQRAKMVAKKTAEQTTEKAVKAAARIASRWLISTVIWSALVFIGEVMLYLLPVLVILLILVTVIAKLGLL